MNTLRRWWRWLLLFVYRRPQEPLGQAAPAPEPEPQSAPAAEPQPEPEAKPTFPNRHARRAWERERRKRDKFVEPKGPEPVRIPREHTAARTIEPIDAPSDGSMPMQGDDGTVYAESELYGLFNFRDTILDQLDRYWIYLRRMRHRDPDAYGFYCKVGATIVPLATWFLQDGVRVVEKSRKEKLPKLSPWWKQHRPAFGCVTYGLSSRIEQDEVNPPEKCKKEFKPGRDLWIPKFLYFLKYKNPPPTIQPISGGDVYLMTIWWDRPQDAKLAKKMKGGTPEEYAVFISKDGDDVHVLPMLRTDMVSIPERSNGLKHFSIPQRAWAIPREYVTWAKRHGTDANTYLSRIFLDAAHTVEHAQYSMVRVAVQNGNLTAIFGLEVKRTPYFFQDRDITLTEKGVKQRIFHIVRAHTRITKSGTIGVPFHFRGLREFDWAGYKVKITVPGRDHFMQSDFDVGAIDSYWRKRGQKFIAQPEIGQRIVDHMNQGVGGTHPVANRERLP